jgi:uncharacterized protein YhfF
MTARWSFNNDYLFDLVLTNRKHGTCCLYTSDKELSKIGDINIIYNSQNQEIKIKITGVCVRRFCDIDEQWAKIEGEGDLSLDYWKKIHLDFFLKENPDFKVTDLLELNNFVIIH